MDTWFEEDYQIRVHPHDPYHLIDIRPSSRHVRVVMNGQTIAETRRPVLLFETGLSTRYYIPIMDVRMDLLQEGRRTTHCAYKGTAPHYSVRIGDHVVENIIWYYPFPNPGYEAIQNLLAFYQDRVDDFYVDGARFEKTKRRHRRPIFSQACRFKFPDRFWPASRQSLLKAILIAGAIIQTLHAKRN